MYTLAQLGFKVDVLKYGMPVILDVINLSVEIAEAGQNGGGSGDDDIPVYDLNVPVSAGG